MGKWTNFIGGNGKNGNSGNDTKAWLYWELQYGKVKSEAGQENVQILAFPLNYDGVWEGEVQAHVDGILKFDTTLERDQYLKQLMLYASAPGGFDPMERCPCAEMLQEVRRNIFTVAGKTNAPLLQLASDFRSRWKEIVKKYRLAK